MKKEPAVDAYIDAAPAEQQAALRELRRMIRSALPRAAEEIGSSGFPVYTLDAEWIAGFATRKKGPMFYLMRSSILDRHAERLALLRSGRSVIEYRPVKNLTPAQVKSIVADLLDDAATELAG